GENFSDLGEKASRPVRCEGLALIPATPWMSHVDERPPGPGNRAYPAARQTPRTPAAGRTTRRPFRPPPPAMLCRPPSPPSGTRPFQGDKRESPGDVLVPLARRLDERRIWPASGLQREGPGRLTRNRRG